MNRKCSATKVNSPSQYSEELEEKMEEIEDIVSVLPPSIPNFNFDVDICEKLKRANVKSYETRNLSPKNNLEIWNILEGRNGSENNRIADATGIVNYDEDKNTIIIAFHGSRSMGDWGTNLRYNAKDVNVPGSPDPELLVFNAPKLHSQSDIHSIHEEAT